MKKIRLLALSAVMATMVVPAPADAHKRPSPASVKAHATKAVQALQMMERLVAQNQDALAAVQFARNQVETRAANNEVRRISRRGARGANAASNALRRVAFLQNTNLEAYAELVDEVGGSLQQQMAAAVKSALTGREQALATLTGLLDRLPVQARQGISRALAVLSSSGKDEVQDLTAALSGEQLPPDVDGIVEQALAIATQSINMGLDRLREIGPQLPAQAQPYVNQALDRVTGIVQQVTSMLDGLFGGGTSGGDQGSPVPGGIPIPQGLPIPSGLPIPGFLNLGGR